MGGQGQVHLAAGTDQDHLGIAVGGVDQHVAAAGEPGGVGVAGPVQRRQRLPAQDERGRLLPQAHDHPPRLHDLARVTGTDHQQAGDGPQRGELLDRLVRRPVLPDPDGVMGEHVDDRQLHQRGQPQGTAGKVGEDQKGRPQRPQPGQGQPVGHRGRRVLADAKVQVAPARAGGLEVPSAVDGQPGLRRRGKIGGAADQPGHPGGDGVEDLPGGVPGGQAPAVGGEDGDVGVPAVGQLPTPDQVELAGKIGICLPVAVEQGQPAVPLGPAPLPDTGGEVLVHPVGDKEVRVRRPVVEPLRRPDLLLPQRLPVRGGGALLGRGAEGDLAVDDDQGRAVRFTAERLEGAAQGRAVVGVADPGDVPAVGDEPGGHVLGERQVGAALDTDVVVVVDPAQVGQPQVAGQRRRLGRDPLHQVAVAAQRVHVVVEHVEAGPVEPRRQPASGDGHAHRRRRARAQRSGGRLHPRRPAVLRVAGAPPVQLAEPSDVVEGDRWPPEGLVGGVDRPDAGQVQRRVQQRRRVPRRQHEPVPVRPGGIVGVEAQELLPQRVDHRCHGHRGTRVPGGRGLHRVHTQGADRRDAQIVRVGDGRLLGGRHVHPFVDIGRPQRPSQALAGPHVPVR